ncbi:MAG: 2OG-Fe dioxygenase family protein [Rhodoferax sp.]
MTAFVCAPPLTPPQVLRPTLQRQGFAVLDADAVCATLGVCRPDLDALLPVWDELPRDSYLRDGGRYRRRRHASFVIDGEACTLVPHRAHWQPLDYNALHGGLQRWFDPLPPQALSQPGWMALLRGLGRIASDRRGAQPWYAEVHPFRIDTTDGIGRPTPEGAHRDGVDFVAVFLLARHGIKGGETRVFDANGPQGQRFTLAQPWSLLLLDDTRVIHETTPIQPQGAALGWRDTLVITLRAGGFLSDAA